MHSRSSQQQLGSHLVIDLGRPAHASRARSTPHRFVSPAGRSCQDGVTDGQVEEVLRPDRSTQEAGSSSVLSVVPLAVPQR